MAKRRQDPKEEATSVVASFCALWPQLRSAASRLSRTSFIRR
jgi:hypothetical protein